MVEQFEVDTNFKDRQHERRQFKLVIEGKQYKGDYDDGEIHWLHPHPKQVVEQSELEAIEAEVYELLGVENKHQKHEPSAHDEPEDFEIEPMITKHAREIMQFKLKIDDEEFKGIFNNGKLEWFHPKPRQKVKDEKVEKIEEKVQEKIKEHLD